MTKHEKRLHKLRWLHDYHHNLASLSYPQLLDWHLVQECLKIWQQLHLRCTKAVGDWESTEPVDQILETLVSKEEENTQQTSNKNIDQQNARKPSEQKHKNLKINSRLKR